MDFRADLHCHTTCSDGSLSPEEVIRLAVEIGLSGLSITDHDTIEAYETALPFAKEMGIKLISGVEFSTIYNEIPVHILGYSFSLKNTEIREFCQKHIQRRYDRNEAILHLLAQHGMTVTQEELIKQKTDLSSAAKKILGRPHIAQVMVSKGYVESIQEAFNRYLGEGKLCYAPGEPMSVEETIDVIHRAGGIAIIAHPHLLKSNRTLQALLTMKFDGLEGYYAKFPPHRHQQWVAIAKHKNWLITGGSDFHGSVKPNIPLGCSWVDEATFKVFHDRFLHNS